MADAIGALRVELSANAAQFEKDMGRARQSVRDSSGGMTKSLDGFRTSVENSVKSLFSLRTAAVALAGAAALGFLIKKNLEVADSIAKTARAAGISAESLQELRYAADLSGISVSAFDSALLGFSKRVGELRAGTGALVTILKKSDDGLLAQLRTAGNVETAFNMVMKAAAGMGNELDRNALLAAAFGRTAGVQMANLLSEGTEGIEKLRKEARDLGLVLSDDMTREAERASDELSKMAKVLQTQLTRVVVSLAPHIVRLGEAFAAVVPKIVEFANMFVPDRFLPVSELQKRIRDVEAELESLAGMSFQQVLAQNSLKEAFGDNAETVRALLIKLRDLDDIVKERVRKDALLAASLESVGEAADETGDKIGKVRDQLKFEIAQISRTTTEQELYSIAKKEGIEVTESFRKEIEPLIDALEREKKAQKEATEAAKERTKAQEERARKVTKVIEENRTAQEEYNAKIEELNDLRAEIGEEAYARAVEKARKELEEANKVTKKGKTLAEELGLSFTSAFEDAMVAGKDFSEVLRGLEQDLMRLIMRRFVIEPLLKSAESGLGSILGSLGGGSTGGASVDWNGSAPGFATGGTFRVGGAAGTDRNLVQFRASRGERVSIETPAQQVANDNAGGAGDVVVNVYAPPGAKVETQESSGPQGRTIDVMIDEAVAGNISTPGSRTQRALRQNFANLNPQLKGRG